MTRNTKQNPQPPRYSKNVRQSIEDRILTFPGTRTSHLSQIRSWYFSRAHWQRPPEFSCEIWRASGLWFSQHFRALQRLEFSQLPRDASSWARRA